MRVVDLTMHVSPAMDVFPGSPSPTFVPWTKFHTHGYDSEVMLMSTHTGTHMDSPSHFAPGLASIDRISPSRFVCSAILVRVPKKANQLVEIDDIEKENIAKNDTVLLATGWEKHRGSKNYMRQNPGLSSGAAKYLARKKINVVAIDGPSIDAGSDSKFTAHKILLSRNILAVENLCNVDKIKSKRFTLVMAPLKLQGATGSPVRAIAIV